MAAATTMPVNQVTATIPLSQLLQKTPMERMQDDAVFLASAAASNNSHLFNIKEFKTNFLPNSLSSDTPLSMSKELMVERENEKSPLFFKTSATFAYCSRVRGCCIFFNDGITEQQKKILYSVACQVEIFNKVFEIIKNALPNHNFIFSMFFDKKLGKTFNLLGLSEDTIVLRLKKETPSSRSQFIYNVAQMQLQMLKFDFLISPNITPYYVKQFLTDLSLPVVQIPPQPGQTLNTADITNNNTAATLNSSSSGVTPAITSNTLFIEGGGDGGDGGVDDGDEEMCERMNDDDDDEDEEIESMMSSDGDDDGDDELNPLDREPIMVENVKNYEPEKPFKLPDNVKRTKPPKPPKSLASSSSGSSRAYYRNNSIADELGSVGVVIPPKSSRISESGITDIFSKLNTKSKQNVINDDGNEDEDDDDDDDDVSNIDNEDNYMFDEFIGETYKEEGVGGDDGNFDSFDESMFKLPAPTVTFPPPKTMASVSTMTSSTTDSLSAICSDIKKRENYTCNMNEEGRRVYTLRYLQTLLDTMKMGIHEYAKNVKNLQRIFDEYSDLHPYISAYVNSVGYERGKLESAIDALKQVENDPPNRLKQAVFIFLITNLLQLTTDE